MGNRGIRKVTGGVQKRSESGVDAEECSKLREGVHIGEQVWQLPTGLSSHSLLTHSACSLALGLWLGSRLKAQEVGVGGFPNSCKAHDQTCI